MSYRAAKFMAAEEIFELGTSLGLTSLYLSASPSAHVKTFEGCPQTNALAKETFNALSRTNIQQILGNFNDTLPLALRDQSKIDLAFIDGDHRKEPTLKYFDLLYPKLHNNSLVVFDDIHWSPEMEDAWNTIRSDERVRVTIDIHRMGFAFFRNEMSPQHFDLRY